MSQTFCGPQWLRRALNCVLLSLANAEQLDTLRAVYIVVVDSEHLALGTRGQGPEAHQVVTGLTGTHDRRASRAYDSEVQTYAGALDCKHRSGSIAQDNGTSS
jgi:hypothetical protein